IPGSRRSMNSGSHPSRRSPSRYWRNCQVWPPWWGFWASEPATTIVPRMGRPCTARLGAQVRRLPHNPRGPSYNTTGRGVTWLTAKVRRSTAGRHEPAGPLGTGVAMRHLVVDPLVRLLQPVAESGARLPAEYLLDEGVVAVATV